MDRKFFIFILILLLLAAGGVFWWWSSKEEPGEWKTLFEASEFENLDNYIIKETSEGKTIVENKKIGLTFKVPDGWSLEKNDKILATGGKGITLSTSDLEPHPNSPWVLVPIKGCLINIYVRYDKIRAELIVEEIKVIQEKAIDRKEVIKLSDHLSLKNIYGDPDSLNDNASAFIQVTIEIPINEIIYSFETYLCAVDIERCSQAFDKFLKTVEINK